MKNAEELNHEMFEEISEGNINYIRHMDSWWRVIFGLPNTSGEKSPAILTGWKPISELLKEPQMKKAIDDTATFFEQKFSKAFSEKIHAMLSEYFKQMENNKVLYYYDKKQNKLLLISLSGHKIDLYIDPAKLALHIGGEIIPYVFNKGLGCNQIVVITPKENLVDVGKDFHKYDYNLKIEKTEIKRIDDPEYFTEEERKEGKLPIETTGTPHVIESAPKTYGHYFMDIVRYIKYFLSDHRAHRDMINKELSLIKHSDIVEKRVWALKSPSLLRKVLSIEPKLDELTEVNRLKRQLLCFKEIYLYRMESKINYLSAFGVLGGYSAQDKYKALSKFLDNENLPLENAAKQGELGKLILSYQEAKRRDKDSQLSP